MKIINNKVLHRWKQEIKNDIFRFMRINLIGTIIFLILFLGFLFITILAWRTKVIIGLIAMDVVSLIAAIFNFQNYRGQKYFLKHNLNQSQKLNTQPKKEDYIMKQGIGIVLGILIILFGMMWIVQGNDFFLYKVFAPKYEDVRRETFEHSRAFRQGTIQELEKMALDYNKASDPEKDAIASVILHRAGNIDESSLPQDLRTFISELRRERMSVK